MWTLAPLSRFDADLRSGFFLFVVRLSIARRMAYSLRLPKLSFKRGN